jgi:hypothetical protein
VPGWTSGPLREDSLGGTSKGCLSVTSDVNVPKVESHWLQRERGLRERTLQADAGGDKSQSLGLRPVLRLWAG